VTIPGAGSGRASPGANSARPSRRGFACSGAIAAGDVARLAHAAEDLGFSSFWVTVLRDVTDPIAVLQAALGATAEITVGLGLIPLDAFAIAELAPCLGDAGRRAIIGLGVGRRRLAPDDFWTAGARRLRADAPRVRIAVGSYSPLVLRAGGALADAALLNWMTPARVRWAERQLDEGARAAGRGCGPSDSYVYLPTAIGGDAQRTIDAALTGMAGHGYHRRHQAAIGSTPSLGMAIQTGAGSDPSLPDYGPRTETVVWPLGQDVEVHRAILESCSPG
jgi:Luciferase-like monooxygenase